MQISNIRVNTGPSAANNWQAAPSAGTATTGTITIAANGASVNVTDTGGYTPTSTGYTMNAFWTDLGRESDQRRFQDGADRHRFRRLRPRGLAGGHQSDLHRLDQRQHGDRALG